MTNTSNTGTPVFLSKFVLFTEVSRPVNQSQCSAWMRENEKDEPSSFYFCWVAHWGNHSEHLSRASHDTQMALVQNAPIPMPPPHLPRPSLFYVFLFFSIPIYSYALTSSTQWCPQAWLLTDASWECRAQLGLIAAVYLIKTWEDPTGVRAREDTGSIYSCTQMHIHTHTPPHPRKARSTGASICLRRPFPSSHMKGCVLGCVGVRPAYLSVRLCFHCALDSFLGVARWQPELNRDFQVLS